MLNRIMSFFIKVMLAFACVTLGAAMVLTSVDVVGRYLFHAPLPGTYELTELLMGFFSPVAIVYCVWKKEHISVDVAYNLMPKHLQRLCVALTLIIQAGISIALAVQSLSLLGELLGASTVTPVLSLPYWPAGCSIALSFVFMAFIYILELFGVRVNPESEKEEARV